MASIDQIIRREINPFDPATFKPGNFWQEQQDPLLNVDSIHYEAIARIEVILAQVAKDHRTRTLILYGDSGSGKSHLLGRLKQTLNPKAFFTYIGPWPDSDFIWRHILRQTVDSLLYVPQERQESQLLLWLRGLPAFRERGFKKWVLGERAIFIRNLRATYPAGIYNAKEFFGVLYDLTNPELYPLACDWLRGDDLDEDDLNQLGVKHTIDNEDAAQNILANFGRISAQTQPIVLCFDQLDNIPRLPDGSIDLQALFSVNSSIHNQSLKNFLVIISIITNTFKQNANRIQSADRARIDAAIPLKTITLEQAEALWKSRLTPLHRQADPRPAERIYPLDRQALKEKFPGGKTFPRYALMLGRKLFQDYKAKLVTNKINIPTKHEPVTPAVTRSEIDIAAFQLVWSKEFDKTHQKISRIRQFSSPELIQMLREALDVLEIKGVQPRFFPSPTYASYSLSYQLPSQSGRFGVAWTEDPNMSSFFHVMNSCLKAVTQNICQTMYLIRAESLGSTNNQGYKRYTQIFTGSPHRHIRPNLTSVHYLATYHSLVNAACSRELVVGDKTPNLKELEALIRQSKILHDCPLLQDLGIVAHRPPSVIKQVLPLQPVAEFLLNLVKTQQFLGRQTLIENVLNRFSQVNESQVEQLIHQLCQTRQIQLLDPNAKPEAQLICLVPSSK